MMTNKTSTALTLAALITASANASELPVSYNFVSLGYGIVDIEDLDDDAQMVKVGASKLFGEHVFAQLRYTATLYDEKDSIGNAEQSSENATFNLGLRYPLHPKADLFVKGGLLYNHSAIEITLHNPMGGGSAINVFEDTAHDLGYNLSAGFAVGFNHYVELIVGANYIDIYDENEVEYDAELLFNLSNKLSLILSGSISEESESMAAGIQFNY